MGGKCGNPRTCKGLFPRISYRLAQMEEAADTADENKAFKLLQHIIPDLVINSRSLSGNGFLAGRKSVADLKTLPQCGTYPNELGRVADRSTACKRDVGRVAVFLATVALVEEDCFSFGTLPPRPTC